MHSTLSTTFNFTSSITALGLHLSRQLTWHTSMSRHCHGLVMKEASARRSQLMAMKLLFAEAKSSGVERSVEEGANFKTDDLAVEVDYPKSKEKKRNAPS